MRSFYIIAIAAATLLLASPRTAHAYTLPECRQMFDCAADTSIFLISDMCFCCSPSTHLCVFASGFCKNPANCVVCDGKNGECTACQPGYEVSGGLCKPVCTAPHCETCVVGSSTVCHDCEPGYILSGTDCVIIPCQVSNCHKCKPGSSTECEVCEPGYAVTGTDCLRECFPANCAECKEGSSTECVACSAGYSPNPSGECEALPVDCTVPRCSACQAGSSTACAVCEPGYHQLHDGWPCKRLCHPTHCAQCVDGSSFECAACETGYKLYANECIATA